MENNNYKLGTLAIHAGQEVDSTGARAVPIHQTTSYVFKGPEHAADLFALREPGFIYSRIMNPTNDVLEKRLAALDGGVGGLAFSSGMAATVAAILNICQSGQHIVSSCSLYGGTITLFAQTFKKMGIEVTLVEPSDPNNFAKAIKDNTRAVFFESIGNPRNDVPDFEAIAKIAHDHGIPVICDNTALTPVLLRPFDYGVDIAMYSCTKFIGGHGNSIGGALVDSGKFDWTNGKFPELTEPDPSYHGVQYCEQFGPAAYIVKCRVQFLRDLGGCMSPYNAFLFLQGLETLHLRMPRHCFNALKLAQFLKNQKNVTWVNYTGLPDHPSYQLGRKYLPAGQGAIVGFGIKGGHDTAVKFIKSVKLLSHLANIGDSKTLVIHPASTTHQQQSDEQQLAAGVTKDYIRISAGTEDIEDIIADVDQALKASQCK